MKTDDISRSELAVLDTIRMRGQATRSDVGTSVGLSTAMIARVVTRLQELNLIREAGRSIAAGPGRQAFLLELQPEAALVLGVHIGTDSARFLIADLHGKVRSFGETPSALFDGHPQPEIVALLAARARGAAAEAGVAWERVAAVGVALTGIIDSERGVCLVRSRTPGWEDFPLAARLGAALGRPVMLEETARAKALAELRHGAAGSAPHFLYVEAGNSIGAGIVIDRRPFRGVSGLAGELGHVTVDSAGPLCRCGNRGCVQASASARAVIDRAQELLRGGVFSTLSGRAGTLTLADLTEAAASGDKLALSLLTDAGERLGEAISMALNLLGLDLVIVGGVLAENSPIVLEAADRIVRLRVLPIVPRERTLLRSALGNDAAARGAALQAIDWLFEDPAARIVRTASARVAPPAALAMASSL